MLEFELTPDPFLLESMRAVGYSFETAVADLIDNSIAASADTIHLITSASGTPRVSLFDDGLGMERDAAVFAMRLAARSPNEARQATDLGRFGLGLKTASLSQCRRLTLATKRGGNLTVLRWDLDHVMTSNRWLVQELSTADYELLFGRELLDEVESGTLVCWEGLDLLSRTEGTTQPDFDAAVSRVKDHCSLVFHRFVNGDRARKVRMTVNGQDFTPFDPFLARNRATESRSEELRLAGATLAVTAFTLPFAGKLSSSERRAALAPGGFRDSQGFYIYRGGRLVVWGTWFRLNPKNEMGKLARVRVDVPNSLDHLWALDIKKSSASPPRELRDALKILAGKFVAPSIRVQKFRGRPVRDDSGISRMWNVVQDRVGFRYEVNRSHPLVVKLTDALDAEHLGQLDALLEAVEQSFPVLDAHNRLSEDAIILSPADYIESMVAKVLRLRPLFSDTHHEQADFIELILSMEPYCNLPDFENPLRAALQPKS